MALKVNPVTLTLYSSPKGRYRHPQRRRRCRPLSKAIHNPPPTGGHNPRGVAPSTFTPKMCPRVRSKNDTGRRLSVRIAMGCQISALPCTPFASSRHSPQGETRSMERKNRESYISCTIPQYPPLVVNAVSQSPACVSCHMIHKANLITLTSYSSPERAIPQPSAGKAVSRVDGIRLLCPPLTEPYVRFSRIRLLE